MSSTVGRLVVLLLTNQSGGSVANGDLVYIDTAHDNAFTTGTTSAYTGMVGVCIEPNGIASSATGRIQVEGLVTLINVNASVTRGHYAKSYTVAKQATDAGASRVTGAFGQFTTGGTTPSIALFGFPDSASSSAAAGTPGLTLSTTNGAGVAATFVATDATVAVFDATVPVADGTAAAGSAGVAARRDHVHPNTAPGSLLAVVSYAPASQTTYTITSATVADVDATNLLITLTVPASGRVLFRLTAYGDISAGTQDGWWGLRETSSNISGSFGRVIRNQGNAILCCYSFLLTGLSAGSHTYKWAFASTSGSTTHRIIIQDGSDATKWSAGLMEAWSA